MLFGQSRHILKVDLLIQFDIVWFIGEKLLQTSLFSSTACSSSDGMLELTCNLQHIPDMSPMWFYYRSSKRMLNVFVALKWTFKQQL